MTRYLRVLLVKVKDTITDRIHVNAGLVALSSLYFRTLMYGAMRESRENEIQLTVDSAEGECPASWPVSAFQ